VADLRARAVRAHRRPSPRLDVIPALIDTRPAGCPWRVGGCDSSDGLVAALNALALPSGTTAVLERDALPLDPAMAALRQALVWCLGGGEDFELVLALPEAWGRALVARSAGATVIGRMEPRQGDLTLRWSDGAPLGEAPAHGYQHYG
jgi:thiamine-monophosphate kinase